MSESEAALIDEWEIPELLATLVDKSLAAFDETSGRYRLLETVRQYAQDRLIDSERPDLVRNRHLHYFTSLSNDIYESMLNGLDPDHRWNSEIAAEQDNLRS